MLKRVLARWRRRRRYRYLPALEPDLSPANRSATAIGRSAGQAVDNPLHAHFLGNDRNNIHKWHHYFEIYHRFFSRFQARPGLRLLEIGVFRGGSLQLWRSYFHADALIVGLDRDPACAAFADPVRRTFVAIGDQSDETFLRRVVQEFGPFDIIIDDGSHKTSHQITSFNVLYPEALSDQGIYLVEDTHSNFWRDYRDTRHSFVDLAKSLVDRLHEPYFGHESELFFRQGHERQLPSIEVSCFGANTFAISFFDSIVVFEKRRKSLPLSEIR